MNIKLMRSLVSKSLVTIIVLTLVGILASYMSYQSENFIFIVAPLFVGIFSSIFTICTYASSVEGESKSVKVYCLVSFSYSFFVVVVSLVYLFQSVSYYGAYEATDIFVG